MYMQWLSKQTLLSSRIFSLKYILVVSGVSKKNFITSHNTCFELALLITSLNSSLADTGRYSSNSRLCWVKVCSVNSIFVESLIWNENELSGGEMLIGFSLCYLSRVWWKGEGWLISSIILGVQFWYHVLQLARHLV